MKELRETFGFLALLTAAPFLAWFFGLNWVMATDWRPATSGALSALFLFVAVIAHVNAES